jgi:hypothetical protein
LVLTCVDAFIGTHSAGQGVGFKEVAGQQGVGLGTEELGPGGGGAFGGRVDAGLGEHFPDRRGRDGDTQYEQFAVNSPIPPVRILVGQAQHERSDRAHRRWSAWALGPGPGGAAASEEVAVPAQDGLRQYQQLQAAQRGPGETV